MAGDRFAVGEIAVLNYGKFRDCEVEIVDGLALRVIMVIRDYRVERETYLVHMPDGEIRPVAPQYLEKRRWRCANADVVQTEERI